MNKGRIDTIINNFANNKKVAEVISNFKLGLVDINYVFKTITDFFSNYYKIPTGHQIKKLDFGATLRKINTSLNLLKLTKSNTEDKQLAYIIYHFIHELSEDKARANFLMDFVTNYFKINVKKLLENNNLNIDNTLYANGNSVKTMDYKIAENIKDNDTIFILSNAIEQEVKSKLNNINPNIEKCLNIIKKQNYIEDEDLFNFKAIKVLNEHVKTAENMGVVPENKDIVVNGLNIHVNKTIAERSDYIDYFCYSEKPIKDSKYNPQPVNDINKQFFNIKDTIKNQSLSSSNITDILINEFNKNPNTNIQNDEAYKQNKELREENLTFLMKNFYNGKNYTIKENKNNYIKDSNKKLLISDEICLLVDNNQEEIKEGKEFLIHKDWNEPEVEDYYKKEVKYNKILRSDGKSDITNNDIRKIISNISKNLCSSFKKSKLEEIKTLYPIIDRTFGGNSEFSIDYKRKINSLVSTIFNINDIDDNSRFLAVNDLKNLLKLIMPEEELDNSVIFSNIFKCNNPEELKENIKNSIINFATLSMYNERNNNKDDSLKLEKTEKNILYRGIRNVDYDIINENIIKAKSIDNPKNSIFDKNTDLDRKIYDFNAIKPNGELLSEYLLNDEEQKQYALSKIGESNTVGNIISLSENFNDAANYAQKENSVIIAINPNNGLYGKIRNDRITGNSSSEINSYGIQPDEVAFIVKQDGSVIFPNNDVVIIYNGKKITKEKLTKILEPIIKENKKLTSIFSEKNKEDLEQFEKSLEEFSKSLKIESMSEYLKEKEIKENNNYNILIENLKKYNVLNNHKLIATIPYMLELFYEQKSKQDKFLKELFNMNRIEFLNNSISNRIIKNLSLIAKQNRRNDIVDKLDSITNSTYIKEENHNNPIYASIINYLLNDEEIVIPEKNKASLNTIISNINKAEADKLINQEKAADIIFTLFSSINKKYNENKEKIVNSMFNYIKKYNISIKNNINKIINVFENNDIDLKEGKIYSIFAKHVFNNIENEQDSEKKIDFFIKINGMFLKRENYNTIINNMIKNILSNIPDIMNDEEKQTLLLNKIKNFVQENKSNIVSYNLVLKRLGEKYKNFLTYMKSESIENQAKQINQNKQKLFLPHCKLAKKDDKLTTTVEINQLQNQTTRRRLKNRNNLYEDCNKEFNFITNQQGCLMI